MPGALFPRIKTWAKEKLFYQDLNGEYDNIFSHFIANYMQGWSSTVAQMKIQTNPGSQGSESLALSVSDEIERLRFEIARIIGSTYHYDTPPNSITGLNTIFSSGGTPVSRVASGRVDANNQPMVMQAIGTGLTVKLLGATTNLSYYINNTAYTLSTDITSSSLTLAPSSNNTCLVNNAAGIGAYDTELDVDTMGANITALIGKVAAFKIGTEYFTAYVRSATKLSFCMRGIFFSSADANLPSASAADNAVITLMKLTWIYLDTTQTILPSYTNPTYSLATPSSPATGDYWFKLSDFLWYVYNGSAFVLANATLIGVSIQDATNCVATRTYDYYKVFARKNSVNLELLDTTNIQSQSNGCVVSVYGNTYQTAFAGRFSWNSVTQIDTGAIGASKNYYVYIKDTGGLAYSLVAPIDRIFDLNGFYHPSKPWRALGGFSTDSGSLMLPPFNYAECRSPINKASSASSANFTVTSAVLADVTGLTLTIGTSGRPVLLSLSAFDQNAGFSALRLGISDTVDIALLRDGTIINVYEAQNLSGAATMEVLLSLTFIDDLVTAGTHVYKIQASSGVGTARIFNTSLKAVEWS